MLEYVLQSLLDCYNCSSCPYWLWRHPFLKWCKSWGTKSSVKMHFEVMRLIWAFSSLSWSDEVDIFQSFSYFSTKSLFLQGGTLTKCGIHCYIERGLCILSLTHFITYFDVAFGRHLPTTRINWRNDYRDQKQFKWTYSLDF